MIGDEQSDSIPRPRYDRIRGVEIPTAWQILADRILDENEPSANVLAWARVLAELITTS